MRIHLIMLTTLITVAGCGGGASVSQNQCIASDWQTLGYRDGANGVRSTRLLAHQDACVGHGIIPDRAGYMLGWEQGIREYCQPNNGFAEGSRGVRYDNTCPAAMQAEFIAAYKDGRSLFKARAEVNRLSSLIYRKEARLGQVKAELVTSAAEQLNPQLSPQERIALLTHTRRLHEERGDIRVELPQLAVELEAKSTALDSLDQSLALVNY